MIKVSNESTNDEIRDFIKDSGITVENVTQDQLDKLFNSLSKSIHSSNNFRGSYQMNGDKGSRFMSCSSDYFEDREAISFNTDGFIGMAGWSDSKNIKPIRQGVINWIYGMVT